MKHLLSSNKFGALRRDGTGDRSRTRLDSLLWRREWAESDQVRFPWGVPPSPIARA